MGAETWSVLVKGEVVFMKDAAEPIMSLESDRQADLWSGVRSRRPSRQGTHKDLHGSRRGQRARHRVATCRPPVSRTAVESGLAVLYSGRSGRDEDFYDIAAAMAVRESRETAQLAGM